jgi:hypothetical protein
VDHPRKLASGEADELGLGIADSGCGIVPLATRGSKARNRRKCIKNNDVACRFVLDAIVGLLLSPIPDSARASAPLLALRWRH